jgi:hypothetical protein
MARILGKLPRHPTLHAVGSLEKPAIAPIHGNAT